MMTQLANILAYTIPSLVVFFTVYYVVRQFMQQQYQLELLRLKSKDGTGILPLRLQAYERLSIMMERIAPDPLYYRVAHPDMSGPELRTTMLLAIQQEYDHNMSQQIYVSDDLWRIIQTVKEQTQQLVASSQGQTQAEFLASLRSGMAAIGGDPLQLARTAIRNEVRLHFN